MKNPKNMNNEMTEMAGSVLGTDLTYPTEGLTVASFLQPTTYVFGEDLKLDTEGFHYKGEIITDNGKAYNAFMEFMDKANNPMLTVGGPHHEQIADTIRDLKQLALSDAMTYEICWKAIELIKVLGANE